MEQNAEAIRRLHALSEEIQAKLPKHVPGSLSGIWQQRQQ